MKRILIALLICCSGFVHAQTASLTSTITDTPDAQAWNNGTYMVTFVPVAGYTGTYTLSGLTWTPTHYSGSLDGSGEFALTVPRNDYIAPSGSKWQFVFCPTTSPGSVNCSTTQLTITTQTAVTFTVASPRFPAQYYPSASFGYADSEVTAPATGNGYFNVVSGAWKWWNGSAFVSGGGGSNPCGTFSLSTFGVLAANGAATNCLSSATVFVDSTFNSGQPLQIDAAGVGALLVQSSGAPYSAGEFNSNSSPGVAPYDAQFDSSGMLLPDGSIIAGTSDFGNQNNVYAQAVFNPQDTVTCTGINGAGACTLYADNDMTHVCSLPHSINCLNRGVIVLDGGTATTGAIASFTFTQISSENPPTWCEFNETDGLGIGLRYSNSTEELIAANAVTGLTITATYTCQQ